MTTQETAILDKFESLIKEAVNFQENVDEPLVSAPVEVFYRYLEATLSFRRQPLFGAYLNLAVKAKNYSNKEFSDILDIDEEDVLFLSRRSAAMLKMPKLRKKDSLVEYKQELKKRAQESGVVFS